MYSGIHSAIRSNMFKTSLLLIGFPVFLLGLMILVFGFIAAQDAGTWQWSEAIALAWAQMIWLLPVIAIWWVISFLFQRQMIFAFSGARAVTRKEEPEIYNIIENMCISRGLATPKIGIIDDDSLNAFALGRDVKHGWIVFTRGILNRLNKAEIEAVAGHELTHIINKDSLLMVTMIVYIGIIATLGNILIRIRWGSDERSKGAAIIPLLGLILLILGYLVYPLLRLAVSRKREFMADAGSVQLTMDKHAMISALEKISKDPVIDGITNDNMAALCIENPLGGVSLSSRFATHPPIKERIAALRSY